jgi:hypothetical protein
MQRLLQPVELPSWGRIFLGFMAAAVLAQLLLITLSVSRALPHFRFMLNPAYLGVVIFWVCGGIGCVAFLGLFWRTFRQPKRIHLAILGLAAFAVLFHAFLNIALRLLFGPPSLGLLAGLGRSLWALGQPGHATAFLTLGLDLLGLFGMEPWPAYWKFLKFIFLADAAGVAVLYLLLWTQAKTRSPRES